jgi:purine-nucleoside phosphorylase
MASVPLPEKIADAASALTRKFGVPALPKVAVVLGSGFKGFEARLENAKTFEAKDFPHFPVPRVQGHGAQIVCGKAGAVDVCVLTGRVHMYEGYDADETVFPIRALAKAGVKRLLLTNAAGSVDPKIRAGQVVLLKDHLNLTGKNCLTGTEARLIGPQFLDMTVAYDAGLRQRLASLGGLVEGVYAGLLGPTYETPAETLMLGRLGANVVGMSTVQETIAARHLNLRVAALSFVTNMAGGLGDNLSHEEVIDLAEKHRVALHELLLNAIRVIEEAP